MKLYLVILVLFAIDQWTKHLAKKHLQNNRRVWHGVKLTYVENKGAAMGFLKRRVKVLKLFNSLVMVLVNYLLIAAIMRNEVWLYQFALTFVIAGGAGNLSDRFTRGYVIDFFSFGRKKMPYFNMADGYIFLGAMGMVVAAILYDVVI